MMIASIKSKITKKQREQYRRFVRDATSKGIKLALEKVPLDRAGFQLLLGRDEEFNAAIVALIVEKTSEFSLSSQFAKEEIRSGYAYPQGYRVKQIDEQAELLRKFFPDLGANSELIQSLAERPLPAGADGWFAIPRWEKIAATYDEALLKVLLCIAVTRKFCDHREGKLDGRYLRQTYQAIAAWKKLGEEQNGDILVVAAQFGIRHRGRSVRRARRVMIAREFGLGAFAVGCMLLTHPEREQEQEQREQLHIDCAGDEFRPDEGGPFVNAPSFRFRDDELRFHTSEVDSASEVYGSASGFLPEQIKL